MKKQLIRLGVVLIAALLFCGIAACTEATVEAVSFSPAAGAVDYQTTVTLQTKTPAARIIYTTDGTSPKRGGILYDEPIPIEQKTVLQAVAQLDRSLSKVSKAVYTVKTYSVSFDVDGKGEAPKAIAGLRKGDPIPNALPVPTAAGFAFDGWYLNEEPFQPAGYRVSGNITLVAHWQEDPTVYLEAIAINGKPPAGDLLAGSRYPLTVSLTPPDAAPEAITWQVEPPSVATVENGLLKTLSAGEATVTAVSARGKTDSFSVKVVGEAAPETIVIEGTTFQRVAKTDFLPDETGYQVSGSKHRVEGGCLSIDPSIGDDKQNLTLPCDYEFNCMRIRFRLGSHQPDLRFRCDNVDLLFLYEHDIEGPDLGKMKTQLFKLGENGNNKAKSTQFYSEQHYSRATHANRFVDFDLLRTGDVLSIWVDGVKAITMPSFTEFTYNNGFFKGVPTLCADKWWGSAAPTGNDPLKIEYVALYTGSPKVLHLPISVIPEPQTCTPNNGIFVITDQTPVFIDSSAEAGRGAAELFNEYLQQSAGRQLPIQNESGSGNGIRLLHDASLSGDEAYSLTVAPASVTIKAKAAAGYFYGFMTLLQLLPPTVFGHTPDPDLELQAPCCFVSDAPRFSYRGLLLDESRHFFGKETVKGVLDELAKVKMNRLHWHFTDDGGYRFPFSGTFTATSGNRYDFDEFMRKTAWRGGENANFFGKWQFCEKTASVADIHGGFYSRDDLAEIIAYAKKRNITIIPEFDIPGHCSPLYHHFESLRCDGLDNSGNPKKHKGTNSKKDLCPSCSDIFEVLDYMLGQIADVFDSEILHVGADEVGINDNSWYDLSPWWTCQRCHNKIKELTGNQNAPINYANLQQLQAYFLKEIEKRVHQRNRKMGIWNEGMRGAFSPADSTKTNLWYWNGSQDLNKAKEKSMKIVNTDTWNYYIDFYQTQADKTAHNPDGQDWGGSAPIVTLQRIYNNDITKENGNTPLGDTQVGVQAGMWNEKTVPYEKNGHSYSRVDKLHYMLFPRVQAVAERAWSPESKKDYNRFKEKITHHYRRLDAAGIHNYCKAQ